MINAMKGKTAAGALTMGDGAAEACMQILAKFKGNKFVAIALARCSSLSRRVLSCCGLLSILCLG
jgi:hypothetical protein